MLTKNIIIDFDSTFIQLEALDELALITLQNNPNSTQIVEQVINITKQGMNGEISLRQSLLERIKLIKANKKHLTELIDRLQKNISSSIENNINFFINNASSIYIVSSGFKEYIVPVVAKFGITSRNIYANTFEYDNDGNIIGLDINNHLSNDNGKVEIVKKLALHDVVVIGDGYTDYEIRKFGMAKLFYAFTENVYREKVVMYADVIVSNFDEFLEHNNLHNKELEKKPIIKILLLENIHNYANEIFKKNGYNIEVIKGSLSEEELCEKIKDVSILGIRSKTVVSRNVLQHANKLLCIGAFCIGTNQIDLDSASEFGVCVFNAPYSNTRSVVELVIGEIIVLMRNVISKNNLLHQGIWDKSSHACYEVRGKKLGIIGYGNIGSQLSVLAESMGMQVFYYDAVEKLQLGNAKKCNTMEELLQQVDIVSLHVDGKSCNTNLISDKEFSLMKDGVIFLNLSRGHVVDIDSLITNIKNKKVVGCAIDVFPEEPKNNDEEFISQLRNLPNTILTPHVGGSTEEAQFNIVEFVVKRILNYIKQGDTIQSVNFPNLSLPVLNNASRFIHIHNNIPGVLAKINNILANYHINVVGQYLKTNEKTGYVITDILCDITINILDEFNKHDFTIKTRMLD